MTGVYNEVSDTIARGVAIYYSKENNITSPNPLLEGWKNRVIQPVILSNTLIIVLTILSTGLLIYKILVILICIISTVYIYKRMERTKMYE
jgi:hypothetical protein